jgi:hypothetical protein
MVIVFGKNNTPNPDRDTGKRSLDVTSVISQQPSTELQQLRVEFDALRREFYSFVSATTYSDERGSY